MMTFKEFLSEERVKTSRMKMLDVKRELAAALGLPAGRIKFWLSGAQADVGDTYAMHVFMHRDDDPAFFFKLVNPVLQQTLKKHFDRFEMEDVDALQNGDTGKKMMYARIRVPDKKGQL